MNDEFFIDRPKPVVGITNIRWLHYMPSPTMKARIRLKDKREISKAISIPTMDPNDPEQVRDLLRRMVFEGRKLAKQAGVRVIFPVVTDQHVAQYVGKWRGRITTAERMEREMKRQEAEQAAKPVNVRPLIAPYVPSPMVETTRVDIAAIAAKYKPKPLLFQYVNVYGEPAAVPML